jgi:integrase/recombinase XerC
MMLVTMETAANFNAVQTVDVKFEDVVNEWLTRISKEKDGKNARAPKTISVYRYALLSVFKPWLDLRDITVPTRQDLIEWRAIMVAIAKAGYWSNATVNSYLASVRSLYRWLADTKGFENIAKGLESMPISQEHKRGVLDLPEMRTLLKSVDTANLRGNSKKNAKPAEKPKKVSKHADKMIALRRLRDKAILAVMMCGGLRTVEVSRLRISDFQMTCGVGMLNVLGKGRSDREGVKISRQAAQSVAEWKKALEEITVVTDSDALFCSLSNRSFGDALTSAVISKLCKFYLETAGLKNKSVSDETGDSKVEVKPVTAHSLRASLATQSYLGGASLAQVKQQLRHRNLKTTLIYIDEANKLNNPCTDIISDAIF